MSKKIRCNVTDNVYYVTEKRYARLLLKYGSEEGIINNYVSQKGKKIISGENDYPEKINNRIRCSITGRWCYISNPRIQAGITKYGSWEEFCKNYISRPATRLLNAGKTKEEIRQMIENDVLTGF